jgi:hypothetical protein
METQTKKQTVLYVSQYGDKFYAKTVKELREQVKGRCGKMYIDDIDGSACHVGYVIGSLWLTAYVPLVKKLNVDK